jgi:glycosyltransferase involved in cell wall biosynthesis
MTKFSRLTIAHLIPNLSGGGAEAQLSYLSQAQVAAGHKVHIVHTQPAIDISETLGAQGVQLHALNIRGNYDPVIFKQSLKILRSIEPQIIQTWIPQMDVVGGGCAWLLGKPWILREATSFEAYQKLNFKQRLRVKLARARAVVVSNSEGGERFWINQGTHFPRRIIQNGIPIEELRRAPKARIRFEEPVILSIGRLVRSKRVELLLQAIAEIPMHRKIKLLVVGDGPLLSDLQNLSRQLKVAEQVEFLGRQPRENVWGLMKAASALVSLSELEGCSNVVQEAMVAKCPLILSKICGHQSLLSENEATFLADINPTSVAASICTALEGTEGIIAKACLAEFNAQRFSISKMADAYDRVYQDALLFRRERGDSD